MMVEKMFGTHFGSTKKWNLCGIPSTGSRPQYHPTLNFCDLIDKFLYVHEDFRNEIFAVTT